MRKRSRSGYALLPGVLLLVASGLLAGACQKPPVVVEEVVRPVKTLVVPGEGEATRSEYSGSVEASRRAEVAFEVPGRIIELPVEEGQQVTEGQMLAKLDPRDYQARLEATQAELRKAAADYERGLNLQRQDKGAIAQTQIDSYKRGVEVAEAALAVSQKSVDDTTLRAPFDGEVARRFVENFENVIAKQAVVRVQDVSELEVKVAVPERDITGRDPNATLAETTERVKPRVIITSSPDKQFPAKLKEIALVADPVSRTFEVTLSFAKPEEVNVLPGMTAKVIIDGEIGSAGIRIPAVAVADDSGSKPYVWIIDPSTNTVSKRSVEIGDLSNQSVAILSGLDGGEEIAVSGVHYLSDGQSVTRFGR
ncbi:MAG: efflux RND transporter periplasmic adaptor subunit [Candidatus Binatia bacterium]|nr:efflux RND transporter periplasmic adaptor subunit [Candidatus Binatia bacterium]